MKNKNQQIISLLKKKLEESITWNDNQKKDIDNLLAIVEELQKEVKEKDKRIIELGDLTNSFIYSKEDKENMESNGFNLKPPRIITPENLEDDSLWKE